MSEETEIRQLDAPMERDRILQLTDEALLPLCRVDRMRGTGPGGQKRNKTESAVRVTLLSREISATDDVSRSQHQNLAHALAKLRVQIAIVWRCSAEGASLPFAGNPNQKQFSLWLAHALDAREASGGLLAPAAAKLGCSTTFLRKQLTLLGLLQNQKRS